jgi:hypothetical protein
VRIKRVEFPAPKVEDEQGENQEQSEGKEVKKEVKKEIKKEAKKEAKKDGKKGKDKGKDVPEIDYDSFQLNSTVPQKVILFEAPEEFILNRMEEMPEEKKENTHYTKEDMVRRLEEYKTRSDESQENTAPVSFFNKRGIEVLRQGVELPEEEQAKSILDFIEKVCVSISLGWQAWISRRKSKDRGGRISERGNIRAN